MSAAPHDEQLRALVAGAGADASAATGATGAGGAAGAGAPTADCDADVARRAGTPSGSPQPAHTVALKGLSASQASQTSPRVIAPIVGESRPKSR